ncbi:hypothetical protein, variant [Sphaeroforma arctica JP610]|uniref:Uncharacterized protein n=1 Tax=Sphaeroforma arctica JP610 TaxID=667725 RepID=A0A0L0G9S1_9EUKA|nr:hypothetical protein, variant [Sphaeroforma arctica JP610]KNC85008.1 hypothetical protein, variant [Sphaeroforma arctica JP610]|eukprot:XP_014158911.1 hypothetical protein, variant [Sphaeroforma arctica JP610]
MIHYFTTSARGVHQWLQITSKLDDGVNISSNNGSKICDEHPVEDINNINRHFGHKSEATTHTHASTHSAGHATTQKRTFTSTQPHTHRTVADLCICGAYTRCVDNYNPKHHLDVDIHSTDGEAVALHHMWAEARNSIARKSTEMLSVSFYKLADAIKADQDRKKGIGNVTGENRVTTIRSDTEMCACGEIKSRCVGNCQVVTELDNVRKYSSPVELSELKQFEGLRSLDQEESESIVDMLKHAGLNWMRIKMLAALSVDLQLEPKKEGDKLFMTEKPVCSVIFHDIKC